MKRVKVWGIWDKRKKCWLFMSYSGYVFDKIKKVIVNDFVTDCEIVEVRPCYLPQPLPKKRGKK